MKFLILWAVWSILLVLCWPVALLVLVLAPVLWLLSRKTFIYVNNRREGNGLTTLAAMIEQAGTRIWATTPRS